MTKGYLCPVCFHGSAEPFRCGGPHDGKYDFVDAVAVVATRPVMTVLGNIADPYNENQGRLKNWASEFLKELT